MRIILILLILLTTACHNVKEVLVPVDRPVYCADMPSYKEYETNKLDKGSKLYAKIEALMIEREQRISTEAELRAIIIGCSDPNLKLRLN